MNKQIPLNDEVNIDGILELCNKPCILTKQPPEPPMLPKTSFLPEFLKLIKPYWHKNKNAKKWTIALVILTVLQIALAVITIEWTALLFNALEAHSMAGLIKQIGTLVVIFLVSIGVTASHMKMKRNLQMGLRAWLTDLVMSKWMTVDTHLDIASNVTDDNSNPDGRITDDIRRSSDEFFGLSHTLLHSLLTLVTFTQMLWILSGVITITLGTATISVYGYLVWIALIYTGFASLFGWNISKPLTDTTNVMQNAECNFRFALAEARENCGKIALNHNEEKELNKFKGLLQKVNDLYNIQTISWVRIVQFNSGYGVLSMAIPVLASAPRYILEKISLGGLMQAAGAFQQMCGALSWGVNNVGGIATWRTSVERVLGLIHSLDDLVEKK
jgi:putative ATP-binding cassette transporter